MLEIAVRKLAPALAAPVLVCSILTGFTTLVLGATVGSARCHCPCSVVCGGGVSCDCGGHADTCAKCSCASGQLEAEDIVWLAGAATVRPVLAGSYAPWFAFEPHGEIRVALEATMADTQEKETFPIRFLLGSKESVQYVPDGSFAPEVLRGWLGRVNRGQAVQLYAAAKDDPASYAIRDGDRSHLNESLTKAYSLDLGNGFRPVFKSDSTLAWEMTVYLKSAVGQLPDEAFLSDAREVQGRLYDAIETVELLLKASDYDGALRVLDDVVSRSEALGLDPDQEDAEATVCAFRKMRSLLAPERPWAGAAVGVETE